VNCCSADPVTITLTGNQTGVSSANASLLRCDGSSLLTLHGIGAGYPGQQLTIVSVGTGQVDIVNQSATEGIAANRIINGVTGTISLAAGVGRVVIAYDSTTARWRVVEHEQGAWITTAYNAGDYTASTGTWTVSSGNVLRTAYYLKGRTLQFNETLTATSVNATPTSLARVIPGGFKAAGLERFPFNYTGAGVGTCGASSAGATSIDIYRDYAATAWASGTLNLSYNLTFEVQ
jgi:hypothetical protein